MTTQLSMESSSTKRQSGTTRFRRSSSAIKELRSEVPREFKQCREKGSQPKGWKGFRHQGLKGKAQETRESKERPRNTNLTCKLRSRSRVDNKSSIDNRVYRCIKRILFCNKQLLEYEPIWGDRRIQSHASHLHLNRLHPFFLHSRVPHQAGILAAIRAYRIFAACRSSTRFSAYSDGHNNSSASSKKHLEE